MFLLRMRTILVALILAVVISQSSGLQEQRNLRGGWVDFPQNNLPLSHAIIIPKSHSSNTATPNTICSPIPPCDRRNKKYYYLPAKGKAAKLKKSKGSYYYSSYSGYYYYNYNKKISSALQKKKKPTRATVGLGQDFRHPEEQIASAIYGVRGRSIARWKGIEVRKTVPMAPKTEIQSVTI